MTKNYFVQKTLPDFQTLCERKKYLGLTAFTSNRIPKWARQACVFHVMVYGSRESQLISSKGEAELFMRKVAEVSEKFGTSVLHYAVMNNHIHLVIFGQSWKEVSSTVRSATMSLAKRIRSGSNPVNEVYTRQILYSVCTNAGTLLKIMRYVTENSKESVHTCYLTAVNEYMYNNFQFVDSAKTCELIGRDIDTISHQLIASTEEFSRFMGEYYAESERSRAVFLPKGLKG